MRSRSARTKAPDPWLTLDRQVCFALYSASLAMTKAYQPLLAPLGLTYPQYLALLALWEDDGLTVSQLGARLSLDSGTLTPLLKRMESQQLVSRQRDPEDERRVLLNLTPEGRALKARATAIPRSMACATGCSLDELARLAMQLRQLRERLTSPTGSPPG